jgi:hypothetical protein
LQDIVDIVNKFTDKSNAALSDPQLISNALLIRAREASEDSRGVSPFQERAIQEGFYYEGGKRDDITILVSVIKYFSLIC